MSCSSIIVRTRVGSLFCTFGIVHGKEKKVEVEDAQVCRAWGEPKVRMRAVRDS